LPEDLETYLRERADAGYRSVSKEVAMRLEQSRQADLKAAAQQNDRSLNGEIVNRLRATFDAQPQRATRPEKGVTQK